MNRSKLAGLCMALVVPALTVAVVPSGAAEAPITGSVIRDFNHDGTRNGDDAGLAGVTVTATAPDGSTLTATTDSGGNYSLAGSDDSLIYRLQFTWEQSWLESGPMGDDSGSATQFVAGGGTADLALVNPGDYCAAATGELDYVTTCFVLGEPGAGSDYTDMDAIVSMSDNASGIAMDSGAVPVEPNHLAYNTVIGSTYGLSWQPSTERLFTSSFLKRHIGLGSGGIDAIYAIDTTNADPAASASIWYDQIDAGTVASNTDRGVATDASDPASADATTFGQIYKVGWGDIDMSQDGSTLFAVNLFDRNLYSIDIAAVDSGSASAHTNLGRPSHTCTNGVGRPYALEILDGKVWMAITCTAENGGDATDLSAAIYSYDLGDQVWASTAGIEFALDYAKGCILTTRGCGYEPWIDVFSYDDFHFTMDTTSAFDMPLRPQPIVSDLEIDRDGYLTIAIRDRQGDQFGHRNITPIDNNTITGSGAGDMLLAAPATDGTWTLESGGVAGSRTSGGSGTEVSGPGGPLAPQGPGNGEFYWSDYVLYYANLLHSETSIGSLALAPGASEIASTQTDPIHHHVDAAGVSWYDTNNGDNTHDYQLFEDGSIPAPAVSGKANALGDLEAMCPAAPVQIGNRVWFDADSDGVQDPDEFPIPGVTVTLSDSDPSTTDVEAITDSLGQWSFTASPLATYTVSFNSTTADVSGIDGVDTTGDLIPTSPNSGSDDFADSDMNTTTQSLQVSTGGPGQNDHSFDAGYTTGTTELELGNLVWRDSNNNGIADGSEPGISGVTVELWIDTDADAIADSKVDVTTTGAAGRYLFANLSAGTYFVQIPNQSSAGEPLSGLTSSTPTNPFAEDNSDNDDNGIDPVEVGGVARSGPVTLSAGDEATAETSRSGSDTIDAPTTGLADNNSNLTVDFGFYPLASLGNYVWYDSNNDGIQDVDELAVPNVAVNLCDEQGTTLATVYTDKHGFYLFLDLAPGTYCVCFDLDTLPDGHHPTTSNVGEDSTDSDADSKGKTGPVTLGAGDQNLTLDLGIVAEIAATPTTPMTPQAVTPSTISRTGNDATKYLFGIGSLLLLLGATVVLYSKRLLY